MNQRKHFSALILLFTACLITVFSSGASAQTVPANETLYKMLLENQKRIKALGQRALDAEAEAEKANVELDRMKKESDAGVAGAGTINDSCRKIGGFFAEANVSYVRPVFDTAVIGASEDYDDGYTRLLSLEHDAVFVPELTLGYEGSGGLGVRAKGVYMKSEAGFFQEENDLYGSLEVHFDVDSNDLDIYVSGALGAEDKLEAWIADLEIYKRAGIGAVDIIFGGGARYVNLDRTLRIWETEGCDEIHAFHTLEGAGPKIFLEGSFPVSTCLSLYGDGSASFLFTQENQELYEVPREPYDHNANDGEKLLTILEAEFGLQYWPTESFSLKAGVNGGYWVRGGGWYFYSDDANASWFGDYSWGYVGGNVSASVAF